MATKLLSIFEIFNKKKKPVKVRDASNKKRFGVLAESFSDAVAKGRKKLEIPNNTPITIVLEEDATEVTDDEYFHTLEPHVTTLVFLKDGEYFQPELGKAIEHFNALKKIIKDPEQVEDMLTYFKKESLEMLESFTQVCNAAKENIDGEVKSEDREWFEGLHEKFKTKSEYMRYLAQKRIRSYFDSAKLQIEEACKGKVKEDLFVILKQIKEELETNKYHGEYFDRSTSSKERICNEKGTFTCEGFFNAKYCEKFHSINPYASKPRRVLFKLWNLDHIIEKKREVIPRLIAAAQSKHEGRNLDYEALYSLLFTRKNLKFVYEDCHKKEARTQTLELQDFYD